MEAIEAARFSRLFCSGFGESAA